MFEGKFPRLVTVHEIENFVYYKYDEGDYYVNGNDIYINNCIDHKKILEKVVSDDTNNFKFEDLWKIYNPAESKKENPFLDLSKEDEDFIRSIIKGDFELSEKLDANTTAKIKTLLAIKLQYPFTEISDNGRFLKAGEDHVIVRSAQNGLLYLDLYHWERLNEANVRLSVYTKNQVQIFDSQDQLIQFTKPQNKSGILRMPNDYDLDDYNALSNITDKGKWHFVFIVNENTKAAMKYNEVMNLDDYNY